MCSLGRTILVYDTVNSGCIGVRAKATNENMVERKSIRPSSRRVLRGYQNQSPRDWWATSSGEMESQRKTHDQNIPRGIYNQEGPLPSNDSNNSDFVNHAFLLWEEQRRQWVGNKTKQSNERVVESLLSAETTYEDILTTNRPFSRPVPLKEMMQFLVRVWVQEGLYDSHR
ncbi:hypothetical protein KP509_38G039900 [Ceratopteris richardii]|uniref:Gag1-like clamp domain-containing protein n=1 Tax=Ceratopteris richardii TaxID=49495 RepID=A0A8T2Q4W4_CERRI|nr:hypothetical protein KP509_38G039900 [Ceratopteris richardii]